MDKEVSSVHVMLHLIFHRNKNQHRRTKWWKWLSILKRATADLAQSLATGAVDSQKQHLATHIIPRCFLAFSTVVADNQFSTLGIVLLAALARLAKITGISHEMRKPAAIKAKNDNSVAREDLGERVRRPDDSLSCPTQTSRPGDTEALIPTKEKEKNRSTSKIGKSKKKKNAIDDLFSGLL